MSKIALITGAGGQDGAYLARLLLDSGYEVTGALLGGLREDAGLNKLGLAGLVKLVALDIADARAIDKLISSLKPDEVYNLAAQSSVARSFEDPLGALLSNSYGAVALMEALLKYAPDARMFQASSGDMFGNVTGPASERTAFNPQSPYAATKLLAHRMAAIYRTRGLFVSCGILYPHESPLRPAAFVTRKITRAAAQFAVAGRTEPLSLGNLCARRDWGYAPEHVRAAWMMLQAPAPDDYILATGHSRSVRQFVEAAFLEAGFTLAWAGCGVDEKGACEGRVMVEVDAAFIRPTDIDDMTGDPSKARTVLGWSATTGFEELVRILVRHDIDEAER